jgi:hypothetical protein
MRFNRFIAHGAIAVLSMGSAFAADGAARESKGNDMTEVWICYGNINQLVEEGVDWDFVKDNIDGVKLYSGNVSKAKLETLEELARLQKKHDFQLSIECGGTLGHFPVDENNGRRSGEVEVKLADKIVAAGGRLDYFDMDGPVSRLLRTGRHRFDFGKKFKYEGWDTIEPCVEQMISSMNTTLEKHPGVKFFALTNFPNWGYNGGISYHARYENRQDWGDYLDVLEAMIPMCREAGVCPVGVTVDNPHGYAFGTHFSATLKDPTQVNWLRRVLDLEKYVKSQDLEFNYIVNSESGGETSNEQFCKETLELLDAYQAIGGAPTRYIIQGWYKYPNEVGPETKPYTLSYLAKEVIKRVKGIPN